MQPVLDYLKPKLSEADYVLLTTLVAALSGRAKLLDIERFREWHTQPSRPID